MAKGLLVEEMEKFFAVGEESVMIQLKVASAPEGDCAKVWAGSQVQDLEFEVQLLETVERKVVNVHEPTGKGPVGAVVSLEDVLLEADGAALLQSPVCQHSSSHRGRK